MRPESVALERSENLYMKVPSSGAFRTDSMRSRFEGGRRISTDGTVSLFSGLSCGTAVPALQAWKELPEGPPEMAEISASLTRLMACWRGEWSLLYTSRRTLRAVRRGEHVCHPSPSCVWALSGNAVTSGGRVVPIGLSGRGFGTRELVDEERRERLARMLSAIEEAAPMPAGSFPAVLAPPAAAVILHEAVGHFAEAAPEGRADLRHRLRVRIATEIFQLWDDPQAAGGPARYTTDDEGVPSPGPVRVVHDGCLVAMLHSIRSAEAIGAEATANGRASLVWDPPIPRMSNLVCSPGESSEEELIAGLDRGLYIHSLAYGHSFGVRLSAHIRLAEWIENGRRTGRFLAGGVIDEDRGVLTRATGTGDRSVFNDNAMCGKEGQVLYDVGTCSPAIRLRSLRLGA